MERNLYKRIEPLVRSILMSSWDPIGIAQEPLAQDEYDSFIPGIIGLLVHDADMAELAAHLQRIEIDDLGLPGDHSRAPVVAKKLLALYRAKRPDA